MKAKLLLKERHQIHDHAFAELRVWQVSQPILGSRHNYKYALIYVVSGVCVIGYDNESGKGDHIHLNNREIPYRFTTPRQLLADFWQDIDQWRPE